MNNCTHFLKLAYVSLNQNLHITTYNNHFATLFNQSQISLVNTQFKKYININPNNTTNQKLNENKYTSALVFKNIVKKDDRRLFLLYLLYKQTPCGYTIVIANWLNWIHHIHNSLDKGYSAMQKVNNSDIKSNIRSSSDIHSFKALLPLLVVKPKQQSKVELAQLYDILHPFINRKQNGVNKDYNRNTLSRLQTSIKEQTGVKHYVLSDVIHNQTLIDIHHKGQMCIPNTILAKDIINYDVHDEFLESLMLQFMSNVF